MGVSGIWAERKRLPAVSLSLEASYEPTSLESSRSPFSSAFSLRPPGFEEEFLILLNINVSIDERRGGRVAWSLASACSPALLMKILLVVRSSISSIGWAAATCNTASYAASKLLAASHQLDGRQPRAIQLLMLLHNSLQHPINRLGRSHVQHSFLCCFITLFGISSIG